METLLAIAALILLVVSFFGLLKVVCRLLAVVCVIAAVWFWYNGGREKLTEGVEAGRRMVLEQAGGLAGEERKILEDAMRDPEAVLGPQKERLREITGKLLEKPEISANEAARKALEQLKGRLDP